MGEKPRRIGFKIRLGGGTLSAGMIFGLFLVVAGTMMFVDNLDILPFRASRLIWPGALIAYGTMTLLRTTSMAVKVWAGAAVVGGTVLALDAFDVLHIRGNILWPLALIAAGVVMLLYRLNWMPFGHGTCVGASNTTRGSENSLNEFALFSQVTRRVESSAFEGGQLAATFGGIEIDLRRAQISNEDRRIVLEANAAFGGIEVRIPEHWRVSMEGTAVFGAYEDKTIPPRPEPGIVAPLLIVRGGLAFGAVVLKN